jgi:hypothetical protein
MIAVVGATFVSRFGLGDACPGIGAAISDMKNSQALDVQAISQPDDSLMKVKNR